MSKFTYAEMRNMIMKDLANNGFEVAIPMKGKREKDNTLLVVSPKTSKPTKVKILCSTKNTGKFMIPKNDKGKIGAFACVDLTKDKETYYYLNANDTFKAYEERYVPNSNYYNWSGEMKSFPVMATERDKNNRAILD